MTQPRVSVIITTMNRPEMLVTAIESVQRIQQANGLPVEIILIDDGHRTENSEIAAKYGLQYFPGPQNGVSGARNRGIEVARGEYLTFLDDDDVYAESNLVPQVALLESNPQFAAVISQIMLADAELNPVDGPHPRQGLPSGQMFWALLLDYISVVAGIIVRTSVAQSIGGMDTSLKGGEDWDWMLRIAQHHEIAYHPEVACIVRQHDGARGKGKTDEIEVLKRRYNDTLRVLKRYSREVPALKSFSLLRRQLKLRGFYVHILTGMERRYLSEGDVGAVRHCRQTAFHISPLHTVAYLARKVMRNA